MRNSLHPLIAGFLGLILCRASPASDLEGAPALYSLLLEEGFVDVVNVDGHSVVIGPHRLTPAITIEFEESRGDGQDHYFCGIRTDIRIDGAFRDHFTTGDLGLGNHASDARDEAVSDWANRHGFAVARWLARRDGNPALIESAIVYKGLTGFRGDIPGDWTEKTPSVDKAILQAVQSVLEQGLARRGLTTVDVKIVVTGDFVEPVETRVDSEHSSLADAALKSIRMPPGNYLLKQYYVVVGSDSAQ